MSFRRACRLLSSTGKHNNEEVKKLIKNGKLRNAIDASNNTLLHHAGIVGNHVIAQFLVDSGSIVDARNDLGQTALLSALETDSPCEQVIAVLLKAGANIYVEDNFGKSALHIVDSWVRSNEDAKSFQIYKTFLENAGDFDDFASLETGSETFFELLLQTNIDLSTADSEGATLVHTIAQNHRPGVTALLRGKKFDVNARDKFGRTPLIYAIISQSVSAVEFFVDEGADLEAADEDGCTALYVASEEFTCPASKKIIQFLLERGANAQIEISDDYPNPTVLETLVEYSNYRVAHLVLAQLAFQEKNGIVITESVERIINLNSDFSNYFDVCKLQLSLEIHRSVTLVDVLNASERKLERYLLDKELASKLGVFPTADYFKTILRKRLSKANSMIELRQTSTPIVCELVEIDYDSYPFIVDDIVNFLDKQDMECLISIFD